MGKRGADRVVWILQLVMAGVFVYFGVAKIMPANAAWVQMFEAIGLGQWFRYLTSALEIVCGLLLLVPRAVPIAGSFLALTMIAATLVRLLILDHAVSALFAPAACFAALVVIVWYRRPPSRGRPRYHLGRRFP
jgi:putative oxidoreductase